MSGGPSILSIPKIPLNFQQTIFFPQTTPEFKPPHILIKSYPYQKNEQDRLRSMDRAPKKYIVYPADWKLQGPAIFYATEIQQMSLETFISLHKQKNIPIEKQFLKSFVKTYDTLNKIHKTGLLHGNLKPTNVMITFPKSYVKDDQHEINTEEIEWKLAEVGINPKSQNKYYSKSRLIQDNGSKSMFVDPKQNDYFSLGVILLQMATLDPIQKIHNDIVNDKLGEKQYYDRMRTSQSKQHFLSTDLLEFIKNLINPKQLNSNVSKVGGLTTLYHVYADHSNKEESQAIIRPFIDYKEYLFTYETIERFFINNTMESVINKLKTNIQREEFKCSEILKYINRELDPEEEFFFPTHEEFFKFIYKYGKPEGKKQDEDLFKRNIDSVLFANYFTFQSHVFYMPILIKIFKPADLADSVLKKAIDRYQSSTQFFRDQTNSKDVWKAQDMFNFFQSIRVPFTQEDIQNILKTWVPNNKENTTINSLKLDEFKKLFKDYSSPKKVQKGNESEKKAKQKEEKILDMFKQLSRTQQNFVNFFRRMPGQNNWQVPIQKVRQEIKKYYKFRSVYEQKQIISELLVMGRHSESDKSIDYIKVLMKIQLYEPIDLFRKVLVERINQDGIAPIYKKYQKNQKGWSIQSLQQFCRKECLDFDEKYQKMFFNLLDKDDSGYINLKELTFKLTGIKEFDMEYIIQTIKNSAKDDGDRVLQAFLKVDGQKIFALGNPEDLAYAFEILDEKIKFQTSHIHQIYNKFSNRKGKFEYLGFMRYFCDLNHIFMKSCNILIDSMYNGDFEKFFKIGLKGDQKKWKRDSLGRVNDMLVLGFKDKQLDQIWKKLDSNDEISLSIEEVGQKFNKHVQTFEEFKGKAVESLNDFRPKKREEDSRKSIADDKNRADSRQQSTKNNEQNNIEKNQLFLDLKSMKLRPILMQCFKKSQNNCSVWIECQKFCAILKDQTLNYNKKFLQNNFSYCVKKTSNKQLFNYLKFFLLIAQFKKDSLKEKSECLRYILTNICKQKRIKASKLFQDYRIRDQKMKLSKFQIVVKDILEVVDEELFFEDINDVWNFFGDPQFITVKNFQRILDEDDSQRLRDFAKDQKEQKSGLESRQRPTPRLQSRQQSEYDIKRKQSEDSTDFRKVSLNQRERDDKYDKNNRNQNDRSRKDSQSEWRNSEVQRKRQVQQKQKRDYDRDRKQKDRENQRQESRQQQRQKEREREKQRQGQRYREKEGQKNSLNRRRKDSEDSRDHQKEDERTKKLSPGKRTSMQENLYSKRQKERQKPVQLSKKQLVSKLQKRLEQKSTEELTRLFMDKNKIDKDELIYSLTKYYDFGKKQAEDLSEHLADFGQVKIETVKKYLRPSSKENQRKPSKESPKKYGKEKQKTVQFAQKQPQRFGDDKMIRPVTRSIKPQYKLANPHKRKLNTPLIKQQIKMIVRSFSQRYAVQEIDKYFFDDSDVIYKDEFIKKCKEINTTLGQQNLDKIFEFLKPNEREEVSIINFKISFSFDENMEVQQEYLPKDLIKELQEIFNAHDKDKSGSIEPSQIESLLATLGFNETQKQIENVFQKIDKNFDNQISFSEFKDFIEDFILPHLIQFENDVDELFTMLKMNDVFNTGCVTLTVLLAIIQRFGVKLTNQQGIFLAKYIGNQNDEIPIYDFLAALYYSSNPMFPPVVKSALYKIKLRRKISLKQIQKTFTNISSNFVMAYTSRLIKSEQLKRSSSFQPVIHESYMFFQDFFYKDFRRIQPSKNDKVLIDDDPKSTTALVQIRIPEAAGVPIPQNSNMKGTILKRAMNVSFFDMSAQNAKHSIITLEAEWDSQIEDQWLFDMKNRAFYMKIGNYDAKKFEKMIVLFELVIRMNDNGRTIDVSCGSASISVKELVSVENKFSKKLKLVSGIPTKSKEIDKVSVTKRSGWKSFLGSSNMESQLSIEIINQKNMDSKTIIPMLHALSSICLVKRKSLHYIWAFRQYFGQRCVDKDCVNPEFANHHTVRAFLLSLDIDDISNQIVSFWRDKIEQFLIKSRQNVKTVWQSRAVMYHLLTDLHMILNSKQFELKMSNPCASVAQNKNLYTLRQKMINEVMENIESYVKNDLSQNRPYKRVKNYNYNYSPIAVEYGRGSLQTYINQNVIKVGKN